MIEAAITSPERDAFEPKPLIVRLRKLEENKKRNYLCRHGRGGQRLDSGAALGGSDEGRASAEEEGRLHRCRGGRRRKQRRKDALKGERKKVELKIRRRRPVAFSSSTLSCASSSPSLLPSPRLSPSLLSPSLHASCSERGPCDRSPPEKVVARAAAAAATAVQGTDDGDVEFNPRHQRLRQPRNLSSRRRACSQCPCSLLTLAEVSAGDARPR